MEHIFIYLIVFKRCYRIFRNFFIEPPSFRNDPVELSFVFKFTSEQKI